MQREQHGSRERGALHRVGTPAQLVQQHERPIVHVQQDGLERRHVRAERGEARVDRLVVSDVGEDALEGGQRGARPDRWDDTRLRHGADQTHRLEEHRLAAGIGTAHHDRELVRSELEVERHRIPLGEQERMHSALDGESLPLGPDRREPGLRGEGVARPGREVVGRDAHLPPRLDLIRIRTGIVREPAQYGERLPSLFRLAGGQIVAQLDDFGRLDEQRRARARLSVHDAAHAAARLAAHRDHVAIAAQSHRPFRGGLVRPEAPLESLELGDQALPRITQALACPLELRRGLVLHSSVGLDGSIDGRFQAARRNLHRQGRHARGLLGQLPELLLHLAHRHERRVQLPQRCPVQHAARDGEALQHLTYVRYDARLEPAPLVLLLGQLRHGGQLLPDQLRVGLRQPGIYRLGAQSGHGMAGDHAESAVEFQLGEGLRSRYRRKRGRGAGNSRHLHPSPNRPEPPRIMLRAEAPRLQPLSS